MTMDKIRAIAWKDIYTTFTNVSLLAIMIAAPLVISTIIGLAFGGQGGPAGNFSDLPVAVVNLDSGTEQTNSGATLVSILQDENTGGDGDGQDCPLETDAVSADDGTPQPAGSLGDLFNVTVLDDPAVARTAVENGDYVAAVIIPETYSAANEPAIMSANDATAEIEVYGNSGSPVSASIVQSVVQSISEQLLASNIAISATVNTVIQRDPAAAQRIENNEEANAVFGCAFGGVVNAVAVNTQQVEESDSLPLSAQLLVLFGSAQAVFFALFTGQQGVISIIEERRTGTLQRMIVSPTRRRDILGGKLVGTFVTSLFQLVVLLVALMLIATLFAGEFLPIWGTNIIAITAIVLALALCVSGLGVLMTGIVRTPEQVGPVGSIVNIVLAILGGAFFVAPPSPLREMSLVYWGSDAFLRLSDGNNDVLLHIIVLTVQGVIFFAIGTYLFNRRIEI